MKINNHFKEVNLNKTSAKTKESNGGWYLLLGFTLAILGPSVVNFL